MMKCCILCFFCALISVNVFCHDFSFKVENENWQKVLEGEARNFLGPYLFFDKENESLIYQEIEEMIKNYNDDWVIFIERNFDNSVFKVSFLTEKQNAISQVLYSLRRGKISKEINIIKHYSLKKIVGVRENYYFKYDENSCGSSQYYLFICNSNEIKSYAFYGKGYSALDIKKIRKIQKKIDKNIYELIKYLLSL